MFWVLIFMFHSIWCQFLLLLIMSFDKIPDSPGNRRREAGSKGGTAFSRFSLFQFPFAFMACSLALVLSSLKSTSWKESTHSLSSSILSVFFQQIGKNLKSTYIISKVFNSMWKPVRIWLKIPCQSSVVRRPAVLKNNIGQMNWLETHFSIQN